jgi:hypothetical protein
MRYCTMPSETAERTTAASRTAVTAITSISMPDARSERQSSMPVVSGRFTSSRMRSIGAMRPSRASRSIRNAS